MYSTTAKDISLGFSFMKREEIATIRIAIKDPFPDPDPNQRGSGSAALQMTLPFLALLTAYAVFIPISILCVKWKYIFFPDTVMNKKFIQTV
jgi:hypothetical protein